jgi:hypothetical protein
VRRWASAAATTTAADQNDDRVGEQLGASDAAERPAKQLPERPGPVLVGEVSDRRTRHVDAVQSVRTHDGSVQPLVRLDEHRSNSRSRRSVDERDGVDVADARPIVTGGDGTGDVESGNEILDRVREVRDDRRWRQARVHAAG